MVRDRDPEPDPRGTAAIVSSGQALGADVRRSRRSTRSSRPADTANFRRRAAPATPGRPRPQTSVGRVGRRVGAAGVHAGEDPRAAPRSICMRVALAVSQCSRLPPCSSRPPRSSPPRPSGADPDASLLMVGRRCLAGPVRPWGPTSTGSSRARWRRTPLSSGRSSLLCGVGGGHGAWRICLARGRLGSACSDVIRLSARTTREEEVGPPKTRSRQQRSRPVAPGITVHHRSGRACPGNDPGAGRALVAATDRKGVR